MSTDASAYSAPQDLIARFTHHRVAANLLMIMMLLGGIYGLLKLNVQFFPNFEVEVITVRTLWTGAAPEDIESAITTPIEQALRALPKVDKLTSTSSRGVSVISLEYPEGTDMGAAVEQVDQAVASVRNLPADAEQPQVARVERTDPVAKLLIIGNGDDITPLRHLVRRFETELIDRGLAKVDISGLPDEQISIDIDQQQLQTLGLSLQQIAQRIEQQSADRSAGLAGRQDVARQLRSLGQQRDPLGFQQLTLKANRDGERITLGDIAQIRQQLQDNQSQLRVHDRPAVSLAARRTASADSLKSAKILNDWVQDTRPSLPDGVQLIVYDENWTLIRDRTELLLSNGLGGLLLVIVILYLFLNGRVAFWVAIGIPTSFMATLFILHLAGGSINMISLFAMIMALGIIVDDAIVVGEDALSHYQHDQDIRNAAELGAKRMLVPVFSSSLTTVAAFLPLLLVGGNIGNILFDIPLVIICVIIASLIESFLILPGHLQHSFQAHDRRQASPLRTRLDQAFDHLRDRAVAPIIRSAVKHRVTTLSLAISALILSLSLPFGGLVNFTFFPNIEGNQIKANVSFIAGTPENTTRDYVQAMRRALDATDQHFGGGLIKVAIEHISAHANAAGGSSQQGSQLGGIEVELIPSDQRSVRNEAFLNYWKAQLPDAPGIEQLSLSSRQSGPPGRGLEIRLYGAASEQLKSAANELKAAIQALPGVSGVEDDMPYGPQQWILQLKPQGHALGLDTSTLANQLAAAYDGQLIQIYNQGADAIEVRVRLSEQQRDHLSRFDDLAIFLANGDSVPLTNLVEIHAQPGFEALRHLAGARSVTVYGNVDNNIANAGQYRQQLKAELLPQLATRYGLHYSLEGRAAEQRDTMKDMGLGAIYGLIMIYLILAWVFASYSQPLIVMAAIPFGIIGALIGHWILGIDLTILSLFGIFGLSGIVVNDSIILVSFYQDLRRQGRSVEEAVIEAARLRFRAVLLTSLTTIAGLTPLLFETSLQAQFLIPMVATIAFGLATSTVLVLLIIPAALSVLDHRPTERPKRLRHSPIESK